MYLIDSLCGHGKACLDEVVATLCISGGPSGDGPDGACRHAIVMSFMGFSIFIKFNSAMSIKVRFLFRMSLDGL